MSRRRNKALAKKHAQNLKFKAKRQYIAQKNQPIKPTCRTLAGGMAKLERGEKVRVDRDGVIWNVPVSDLFAMKEFTAPNGQNYRKFAKIKPLGLKVVRHQTIMVYMANINRMIKNLGLQEKYDMYDFVTV